MRLFKKIFPLFKVAPMIWVQNQLEYAIVGHNVSLHCNTESFPPAIHYWRLENGSAISSGKKFHFFLKNAFIFHLFSKITNVISSFL